MLNLYNGYEASPAWVNDIQFSGGFNGTLTITTLISGTVMCGGTNFTNPTVPVCVTTINSHNFIDYATITYMNDGSNARNAPNAVNVETLGKTFANMSWLNVAAVTAFEGTTSSQEMVGFYPGTVNPMFWWATPNLQVMATSLVSAGMETAIAMVLRVGITRTYNVHTTDW
jgi:hypothetical protein